MRRGLRSCFFIVVALIYCAFAGYSVYTQHVERTQSVFEQLRRDCELLAWEFTQDVGEKLTRDQLRAKLREFQLRVTLIDANGDAIEDTYRVPDMLDNMRDRPEVIKAKNEGYGDSERFSATMQRNMFFFALALDDGRVLRLSTFTDARDDATRSAVLSVVLSVLLLEIVFVALVHLLNHWTFGTVRSMKIAIRTFAAGDFSERVQPMRNNLFGLVEEYNTMCNNVQRVVEDLRRKNSTMSTMILHMQSGILAVDESLRIMLVNPAAKRLLGMVGAVEGMVVTDASRDVHIEQLLRDAMGKPGVYTGEVAARTSGGRSRRPLRLYVTDMRREGDALGAVALIEDITELRKLEQVRTDFAANVSHELKTPLTSIKGFVETLQEGAIDNPEMARKFLNIIALEADRLTRLINDILSLTRMESGRDAVELEPVRLDQIALEVCDMLRMRAAQKNIAIHCSESAPPTSVWGNKDRVRQLFINLVDNGVKYTPDGGSVTVAVFRSDDAAYVSVSDTGIGIAEEHMPRLFERFYRVDKGRSRAAGGTGLGLAIVKHITVSMNGHIEVHSKVGAGTEFLITLPLHRAENDENEDEQ